MTTPVVSVAVGSVASTSIELDLSANLANTNEVSLTPVMTAKPADATVTILKKSAATTSGATGSGVINATGEAFDNATLVLTDATAVGKLTATGAHTDAGYAVAGQVSFTPDVAGVYRITVTECCSRWNSCR